MAISLPQGFKITSKEPIDSRMLLTKAEMVSVVGSQMPDKYICICKDDGKFYIYDKSITVADPEYGKFVPYEKRIDIPAAIQNAMTTQPQVIENAISKTLPGALAAALESQPTKGGLKVYDDGSIGIDYNDEQFNVTVDNKLELAISLIQAIDSN